MLCSNYLRNGRLNGNADRPWNLMTRTAVTFLPRQQENYVLAFPWSCASAFGGRAGTLQRGSSVRHPRKYLDFVLQLQHQIFVLFFSLLYFKWVGNVLRAGNGNGCFVSTAVLNKLKPVEGCWTLSFRKWPKTSWNWNSSFAFWNRKLSFLNCSLASLLYSITSFLTVWMRLLRMFSSLNL